MMAVETPRPTRRDAVRNRQRILKAASGVLAEKGLDASMDAVAVAAGVGVGTVYRHFPRREHLIAALFDDRADEMVELVRAAHEDPDAWHGLTWMLERAIEIEVGDRALSQILADPSLRSALLHRGSEDIAPLVDALVERAKAQGRLRDDVSTSDFALLRTVIVDAAAVTRSTAPDTWRRLLALSLDGLSNRQGNVLPGRPLTLEEVAGMRGSSQ